MVADEGSAEKDDEEDYDGEELAGWVLGGVCNKGEGAYRKAERGGGGGLGTDDFPHAMIAYELFAR